MLLIRKSLIRPISALKLHFNGSPTLNSSQKRLKVSLSYSHCPGDVPLVVETIGDIVDRAPELYGDRESIVDCQQGLRKTFAQHVADINRFAAGLLALNLNVGDRIGVWGPNRYEWTVAALAASKAGLIMVPLNPAYQPPEMDYCMRKLGIRAVVAHDHFKTQDYYKMMNTLVPELSQAKPGQKVKSQTHQHFDTLIMMSDKEFPGAVRFNDVYSAANKEHTEKLEKIQPSIESEKPAYIMFTSGTTGKPKAAMISHYTLTNSIYQNRKRFLHEPEAMNRICLQVPLFHIFGNLTLLAMVANGSTTVFPSMAFNPAATIKAIESEKCIGLQGTATMFVDVLNHPDCKKADLSTLDKIVMGGSLCPPPLLKRIKEEWKCQKILTTYGSTETSGGFTCTLPDGPWDQVLSNCGPPMENMELKLVDGGGRCVARGERGEICARGYRVMLGYWGDEQQTREALKIDGWYHTGDVGVMLDDGSLQIVDRIKDLIIRGGENIYPKEIEDLLMEHPQVSEAYVFGVPDERLNEEVCVWVRCKHDQTLNESDIREFCKGKIAHFKIPRYVRFVENFPKTLSGKVQKFVMREEEAKKTLK